MTCVNRKGKPECKKFLPRGATILEDKLLKAGQASVKCEASVAKRGAILQVRDTKHEANFQPRAPKHEAIFQLRVDQPEYQIRVDRHINGPELDSSNIKKVQWAPGPSQQLGSPHDSSSSKFTDLRNYSTKMRNMTQTQSHSTCHCEQLIIAISAILDNCCCTKKRVSDLT